MIKGWRLNEIHESVLGQLYIFKGFLFIKSKWITSSSSDREGIRENTSQQKFILYILAPNSFSAWSIILRATVSSGIIKLFRKSPIAKATSARADSSLSSLANSSSLVVELSVVWLSSTLAGYSKYIGGLSRFCRLKEPSPAWPILSA